MARDYKELTPFLQEVWIYIRDTYKSTNLNKELFLTCTYRTPEEQTELYAKGRTRPGKVVTNCDGVRVKSKHNSRPSRAFDFAIKDNGLVVWAEKYFIPVGKIINESKYKDKIRWGGTFSFKDYPHVEEV